MPALRESQDAFAAALFSGALPGNVTAVNPEEAQRRFAVYRNNVMVGLTKALATRFPVVERLVGEDFFRACAREFVLRHPPRSRLLMRYGESFPDFLAAFGPAKTLPYLPDVARIEVARGEAYHAADASPLGPDVLAQAAEAGAEDLRLSLHPSLRIVSSAHPAFTIWSMNQPGRTPTRIADWRAETALVLRPRMSVLVEAIAPARTAFLTRIQERGLLSEALEAGLAQDPEFDPGTAIAWIFATGLVVAVN